MEQLLSSRPTPLIHLILLPRQHLPAMSLSDITRPSIGRIVAQAFLCFVVLHLWFSIMLVFAVFVPLHDAPPQVGCCPARPRQRPQLLHFHFIALSMLAYCAVIATLQIVMTLALLPFARASERAYRACYRLSSLLTSIRLFSKLSGTWCLLPTTRNERP
jgi:hypothetical protein